MSPMMRRPSMTWKMPRRTILSARLWAMLRPSKRMSPAMISPFSALSRPEIDLSVVDLPAPLGPSSVTMDPLGTAKLTPRSTSTTSS